ncbi:MAG TPA: hypothetical protein VLT37_09870, partial [Acidocella sp.]|nr:hypothetical protein [Acidocella sp.]
GLLDRLEAHGYILRRASPGDRRAKLVEITAAGTALLNDVQDLSVRMNEALLQGLPADDIAKAQDILQSLKMRLIEMNNDAKAATGDGLDEVEPYLPTG